jgi:bla regulator protein BlaR1
MGLFSQRKELTHRINEVLKSKNIKTPNFILIAGACLGLTIATAQAAHSFAPKISINDVQSDSLHYSLLNQRDGLKLVKAVVNNDIKAIINMQNEGIDINTPAIGDGTALMVAVRKNNKTMVQALIDLGANVNQSSLRDGNPLINASMLNNLELAQLLINQGANVNAVVPRDETPLINATRRGHLKMSQLLVSYGADVNLKVHTGAWDGNRIRTPLNMARTQEIKDYLIENGAKQD